MACPAVVQHHGAAGPEGGTGPAALTRMCLAPVPPFPPRAEDQPRAPRNWNPAQFVGIANI